MEILRFILFCDTKVMEDMTAASDSQGRWWYGVQLGEIRQRGLEKCPGVLHLSIPMALEDGDCTYPKPKEFGGSGHTLRISCSLSKAIRVLCPTVIDLSALLFEGDWKGLPTS